MAIQKDEAWLASVTVGLKDYESGNYQAAEQALRQKLVELKRQVDIRSGLGIHLMRLLGNVCREQERFDEADELYEAALVGFDHENNCEWRSARLKVLRDYAMSLILQGRFSDAYEIESRALKLAIEDSHLHSFDVNVSLARLCVLSRLNTDYPNAEKHYLACLKLREPSLSSDNPLLRPLLADLGLISFRLGKFKQAEEFNTRALRAAAQDADGEECAELYRRLGLSLCAQERHADGQFACTKARDVGERTESCDSSCISELADVYCRQEKWDAARKLCDDALSAAEFGDPESSNTLANRLQFFVRMMHRLNFCEKTDLVEKRIAQLV